METTPASSLRFAVIWHHQIDEPHFDLLVEIRPGSDLVTWRSPIWPMSERTPLIRLKDHRRIYLDYEGQLTEGRGRVDRVAEGNCDIEIDPSGVWTVTFAETFGKVRLFPIDREIWEGQPLAKIE